MITIFPIYVFMKYPIWNTSHYWSKMVSHTSIHVDLNKNMASKLFVHRHCFLPLSSNCDKKYFVVINIMQQMLSIELNVYWMQNIPLTMYSTHLIEIDYIIQQITMKDMCINILLNSNVAASRSAVYFKTDHIIYMALSSGL